MKTLCQLAYNLDMDIHSEALKFLESQNICSLTTLLPDGSPHAAALHFSYTTSPFEIYFSTDKTSKKCRSLTNNGTTKASFVIGFKDNENTLQMNGDVELVTNSEKVKEIENVHYERNPNSAEWRDDPNTVFLKFTPTWWRYSDYNPYKIYSSED